MTVQNDYYACSEVPGFDTLRQQPNLKEILLAEVGSKESFVERATTMIRQNLVGPILLNRKVPRTALLVRLRKDYETDAIARALAVAWLNDSEQFSLPKITTLNRIERLHGLKIFSYLLSLLTIFGIVMYGRHHFVELLAEILWFVPLLSAVGIFLGIFYYKLLKLLVKLLAKS